MLDAIQKFRVNMERVDAMAGLYEALSRLTAPVMDVTDLLRAQIVMTVSALDHYIHEITRIGMLEVYNQTRPSTDAFLNFQITMNAAMTGLAGPSVDTWFEMEIREKHGYLAFQHSDKIADAIRLFSSRELWPSVASQLNMTVQDVKNQLRLIVQRRNKIVHEADLDPSYPGSRWPISISDAENSANFIKDICEAIHSVVV